MFIARVGFNSTAQGNNVYMRIYTHIYIYIYVCVYLCVYMCDANCACVCVFYMLLETVNKEMGYDLECFVKYPLYF